MSVWKLKDGEESIPSVEPGLILLAVRTCLDIFRNVGVHPGPPEVSSYQLDQLLMSEVSYHFTVVFVFENCKDHWLGDV